MSLDDRATASGRLRSRVRSTADLSAADRAAMWGLFRRYYTDVERSRFERDLDDKGQVIWLADSGDDRLRGFTTVHVHPAVVEGRPVTVVFSGDTVVDRRYWGQSSLHRAFFRVLLSTKLRHWRRPVYWFLISKGYKTYLLLSRHFPLYFPRHDRPTPPALHATLERLASARFGAAYDARRGIVRSRHPSGRLRPAVAPVPDHLRDAPDVAFFVRANPGHAAGDELCCLGVVDFALVLRFWMHRAQKALRRWRQRWHRTAESS